MMNGLEKLPSERRALLGNTGFTLARLALAEPPLATAQGFVQGTQADGQAASGDLARHRARDLRIAHWRSDAAAAFALGEDVAIALLREQQESFAEPFEGFALTRFDGTRVTL